MIREYAIEPASMLNWQRFRYVFGHMGCNHGRIVADDHKTWASEVWRQLKANGASDNDKKRIVEYMNRTNQFAVLFAPRTGQLMTYLRTGCLPPSLSTAASLSRPSFPKKSIRQNPA